ncbi:hypothetical protein BaRGS_00015639 [Batillaria attramentaria]|uniref:C2H2-type domain-containing protein n=1 Tax=Batillaria attramentaria TaxID=370345 RepID=A0ABD0L0S3_9CAEN
MGPNTTWDLKTNSRGTQTDLVTDRNISECLMELKSTPEFQGLAYRIGHTRCKGGNCGCALVLGNDFLGNNPQQISRNLERSFPETRFLVIFRFEIVPVEVVDLKPNGHFALRLFRNILRKLNGRSGFGFCPGFKESDFPPHFQFRKHGFDFIRQPFTRIQAKGCPVFFQQRRPRPGGQELGSELCARCLQVGMGVCETLKESGADGDVPGLVKTLTKVGRRSPTVECAKHSSGKSNGLMPIEDDKTFSSPGDGHKSQRRSSKDVKQGPSSDVACTSPTPTPTSCTPTSSATSSSTASGSHTNHLKQPNPVPAARIKPFRTIAPQARNAVSSAADGSGQSETVVASEGTEPAERTNAPLILRLKLGRSVSVDGAPPTLTAEMSSPPASPRQLCIDEDADPEELEPAVDREPDAKRLCLRCSVCPETFSSQSDLHNHLQGNHPADTSPMADSAGADAAVVSETRQDHPTEPPSSEPSQSPPPGKTCPVCKQQFVTKEDLEVHLRERHRTRLHPCRYCGQKFALKSNLSTHILSHTGSAHLKCQECGAKFSKKKKYAEHIREHMGSLPFFCKICTKLFSREKTFEEHMERHKTRRGMKTLVGTEKMTQGIMDRARRCLEDRVQMALPVSVGNHLHEASGSPIATADQSSTSQNSSVSAEACSQPSDLPPASEAKQALCPSSNLHLLSAVSLAQAELDQYSTSTSTTASPKVENSASNSETADAKSDVQNIQTNMPVASKEAQLQQLQSAASLESGKMSPKNLANNLQETDKVMGCLAEDSSAPTAEVSNSQTPSPASALSSGTQEVDKSDNKADLASELEKKNANSSIIQRLAAPPVSSLAPVSSSSASSSVCTSPSRSQSSPASSQAESQSEENRHMGLDRKDSALTELEERERRILQREQELKEREEMIAKKNMVLFQQLLLAQLSHQPRPAGPSQGQPSGTVAVGKGERMPGGVPLFGVLRGIGPGPTFRAPAPGTFPRGLRPPMLPSHRFPVTGVLVPTGPQQGPRSQAGPLTPQIANPLATRLQRPDVPGSEKPRPNPDSGAPRRRRPMTTPTPPPPDAPPPAPGTTASAPPPPHGTAQKKGSPQKTNPNPTSSSSVFGSNSFLQELMKLESKMPETAKQFLPKADARSKKQTVTSRPLPVLTAAVPPPNIPNTVLTSLEMSNGSSSKGKRGQSQVQTQRLPVDPTFRGDGTGQARWCGGSVLGKEKLGSLSMTLVPPSEMHRLLNLARSTAPVLPQRSSEGTPGSSSSTSQQVMQARSSPSPARPQTPAAQNTAVTATATLTSRSPVQSPPVQAPRPLPPPYTAVASSALPVSSGTARQPHTSLAPSSAPSRGSMAHAPPPLCLPNAAGGLPVPMPASNSDEMAPIDLRKPSNRSSVAEKNSESDNASGKKRDTPMDLSSTPPALLRQYLMDPNVQARNMHTNSGERGASVSPQTTLRSPHGSPPAHMPMQTVRSQTPQAPPHPQQLVQHQVPSSSPLVPVSLHPAVLSQASPLSPPMPLLSHGPMSPPQLHPQMPMPPRGPVSPQIPMSSQAPPQPQRPMSIQSSAPPHTERPVDRMMSPRVVLSRIDGVIPVTLGTMQQGMPPPRFAVPAPGMVPVRGIMPPPHMMMQFGVRSPPDMPSPQRLMSPPNNVLSSPPPTTPPNFLLPVTQATDTSNQPEAKKRDTQSTVPLGGFTWHRPAAVDPVYGPQSSDKQDSNADHPAHSPQLEGSELTVDGSSDERLDSQSNDARNAWQEQFLQTLKKQRRHREQMQQQHQQFVQQHLEQHQQVSAKPPAKRGRPKKKRTEDALPELAGGGTVIPFSPSGLPASTASESLQRNLDDESGRETLLNMPVLSDEHPPRRPRKRQARKRKQTNRVDVQAMEMANGGEDFMNDEGEMQVEQTEDVLNCDICGKVFRSEADILQHECGGE